MQLRSTPRDLVAIGISKSLRPIAPSRAHRFRQRVETGEVEEGVPFAPCPRPEPTGLGGGSKDQLQRLRLELEDPVVIDEAVCVGRLRRGTQGFEIGCAALGPGHILDADVRGVQEATRRRVIRRGLVGDGWRLRAERVEQQDRRTLASRPAPEPAEVAEVADAPAVLRPQRVQLHRPTPGAIGRRRAWPFRRIVWLCSRRIGPVGAEAFEDGGHRIVAGNDAIARVAEVLGHHTPTKPELIHDWFIVAEPRLSCSRRGGM